MADVSQLRGLSDLMGRSGFTPLLPEELTSGVWRRMNPLGMLVDDIGKKLVDGGLAQKVGRLSHEAGSTSLKLKINDLEVFLCFDAKACSQHYATPFWLMLPASARAYLAVYGAAEPRELFEVDGKPYLALPVRTGVERDEVVNDVVKRCSEVASKLAPALGSNAGALGPAPTTPSASSPDSPVD